MEQNNTILLRDYQQSLFLKTKNHFRVGKTRVLVVAPCGSGKSYIFANMVQYGSEKGEVLILIHRNELKQQHLNLFKTLNINTENIRIESVFTEVNHLSEHTKPVLIILDEAHLSRAKTWETVINHYNTYIVGFTATPIRLDNKPLGDIYDSMASGIEIDELIEKKCLAPFEYFAPISVNTEQLKTQCGDYSVVDLEKLMCDSVIYGDVIKSYQKIADNEQAIVYCVNKKHARETAEKFKNAGYKAAWIDSDNTNLERSKIIRDFKNGEITVLCNCGIISEGVSIDICSVCILLRPTQSLALYIQQATRCMRYLPNKTAKIIDCVGNYTRHGLPNEKHEWSLITPVKKQKKFNDKGEFNIRVCQNCFRSFLTAPMCPFCGEKYEKTERELKEMETVEISRITAVELEELERQKKVKRMEVGMCKSRADLIKIARERGYDMKWVWIQQKIKGIR